MTWLQIARMARGKKMTAGLSQPSPTLAAMDQTNVCLGNAELLAYFTQRLFSLHGKNLADHGFREFSVGVPFTTVGRTVLDGVRHVFGARFPRQVSLGDAPLVTFAARMRSVVFRRRWRSMPFLADKTRNTRITQAAVACRTPCVRPRQAVVAIVGQHDFAKVPLSLAHCRTTSQRIAMLPPAFPMSIAPAARPSGLAAVWNRAYPGISHVEPPMLPWSERVAVFPAPGALAFLPSRPTARNRDCRP